MCESVIGARAENRTRRETATLLISPTEYAIAENTYEGMCSTSPPSST